MNDICKNVKLYLMRHGQTIINKAERVQGWCDGVLTDEGVKVAESVALGLRDIEFKAVYSSDLGRAIKTAKIVIKANRASKKLELVELDELREACFGKYEGEFEKVMKKDMLKYLNLESLEEAIKIPDFAKAFANTCAALDDTGTAENYDKLISRIKKGLNKIIEDAVKNGGGNVLVVLHGGVLRSLLDTIDKTLKLEEIKNSSISIAEYIDGKFKVAAVNDMSYKIKGDKILNESHM